MSPSNRSTDKSLIPPRARKGDKYRGPWRLYQPEAYAEWAKKQAAAMRVKRLDPAFRALERARSVGYERRKYLVYLEKRRKLIEEYLIELGNSTYA